MKEFHRIQAVREWIETVRPDDPAGGIASLLKQEQDLLDLLALLETTNPCGQIYYADERAFAITYHLKLNLLTFLKKSLRADVQILGLPISLSRSGILAVDEPSGRQLALQLMRASRGLSLALNTDWCLDGTCRTLPNYRFFNCFGTFEDYVASLRAPYRRNIRRILRAGQGLRFQRLAPADLTGRHYELYRSVVGRSDYPLETLPPEFFRRFDGELIEVRDQQHQLKAVLVLKRSGGTLNFMFCGFQRDDDAALYHNLLLYVIRKGIAEGCRVIDMGQTSGEAKLRLGCQEQGKYLTLHHSNGLLDAVIQPLARRFSFRQDPVRHRVFHKGI